jgi:Leucine-rich repeat (LRR) protein
MFSQDEKQNIAKIKKLIRVRDFEKIEMGIELVRSLNNPKIFDELLGNVELERWDKGFKHDWKGAGPDEHYFQTAILGLLNFSPKGSKGYDIRESVQTLILEGEIKSGYSYIRSKVYLKFLSNFSSLKILKIKNYKEIVGFEEIFDLPLEGLELDRGCSLPKHDEKWGFKNLKRLFFTLPKSNSSRYADDPDEKIELKKIPGLDFLSNLTSLETIKISSGFGFSDESDFSIKGLSYLKNLKFLYCYDLGVENVNDLNALKNLNYVVLKENNLTDISGLTSSANLEFLDLSDSSKLSDITPLDKLKNIKLINLSYTSVKSLNGLENCINLHGIDVQNSPVKNLDGLINSKNLFGINAARCEALVSVEGIKNSLKLKEIILNDCPSLLNLKGLENCEGLKAISISKTGIFNLDPLINCKKIFRNNTTKWDEETPEWNGNTGSQNNPFGGVDESVEKVGYGNLYQAEYFGDKCREYYPIRSWSDPSLNEFVVHECPNLDSVEGLKNSGIQLMVINECPSIKNIDYLAEFPLLQCCDFTDCTNLESVESLSSLSLIDVLILKKCYNVKPKPRFLLMDSFEKVNEYLSKFKKNISEVKLDPEDKIASEKLEELLLSDNYSDIELGLELANSLSNKDIFDYLLEGVKFLNKKIVANSKFLGNDKTKEFRDFALEGLISIAPDSCKVAKEIKVSFKEKTLTGSNITSLLSVSGFSNLEKLTITKTNISTVSDLSRLKNLKTLLFSDNSELRNLSGIAGLDNLEALGVKNCKSLEDLCHVSGFKKLSGIQINNCGITSTSGLKNLPFLKNINLNDNAQLENVDDIGKIDSLEIVTISGCPNIKRIDALTKLDNLSFLRVGRHNLQNTEGLSSLIKPLLEGLKKE